MSKRQKRNKKCQKPTLDIVSRSADLKNPVQYKKSDLINIVSVTTINCGSSLTNVKSWSIYMLNQMTSINERKIFINNNPTLNYAELVLQPHTLNYGIYRIVYTVKMSGSNLTSFESQIDTFIQIIPSGLVISALRSSQPVYGGTIEITRGLDQQIQFNPFLHSYDIDSEAVITSLSFKYSCQIIDSNIQHGYPQIPGTNQFIYLDDFKMNSSLSSLNSCFNSSGYEKIYLFT